MDGFGAEIGGCTAGPDSLLHQAEFGSMREEERGGEGGGSLHKSRLRFSGAIRCRMSAGSYSTKWSGCYATNPTIAGIIRQQARGL